MSRVGYQRVPLGDSSAAATDLTSWDKFNFIFRDRVNGVYDAADSNALSDFKKELYLINPYFYHKHICFIKVQNPDENPGENPGGQSHKINLDIVVEAFLDVQNRYLLDCKRQGVLPNVKAIKYFKKKCHALIREQAGSMEGDPQVPQLSKVKGGCYIGVSKKESDLNLQVKNDKRVKKSKLRTKSKWLAAATGVGEGVVAGVASAILLPTHLKLLALLPGLGGAYSNYDTLKGEAYDLFKNYKDVKKINGPFKAIILVSCVVTAFLYAALQLFSWTQMNLGLSNVAVLALGSLTAIPSFVCLLGIILGSFKKFYDKDSNEGNSDEGDSGFCERLKNSLIDFFSQSWSRIFKTILKVAIAVAVFSVVSYFSMGIFTPIMLKLGSAAWLSSLGQGLAIVNTMTWAPLLIPSISNLVGKVGSTLCGLFVKSRKNTQKSRDKYQGLEISKSGFISFFKHLCCGSNSVGQGGLSANGANGSMGNKLLAAVPAGLQSEGLNCTSIGSKDRIRVYRDSSYLEKEDKATIKIQSSLFRPYLARWRADKQEKEDAAIARIKPPFMAYLARRHEKKWYEENSFGLAQIGL